MTSLVEGIHTGEFLVSEAEGTRSREEVTVTLAGRALASGTVMAKLALGGKYVPYTQGEDVRGGEDIAVGVLYTQLAAKTGDSKAVIIARDAEVYGDAMTGMDANAVTDLATIGVIVRGWTEPAPPAQI